MSNEDWGNFCEEAVCLLFFGDKKPLVSTLIIGFFSVCYLVTSKIGCQLWAIIKGDSLINLMLITAFCLEPTPRSLGV